MTNYVDCVIVRFTDITEEQFHLFDMLMETNKVQTKQWCYRDSRT